MGKEEEIFDWFNNNLTDFSGNEGFHTNEGPSTVTAQGNGRLYMGVPAYDSDTLKARLKNRIDTINQPEAMEGKNTTYLDKLGKTLSATAGAQGSAIPDLHKEATYSQDDLIRPFANSTWNKASNAGNGGEGAPLDPGYTQATFRYKDISEPIVNIWNKSFNKTEQALDSFGKNTHNRYAHTPDNDIEHVRALSDVNWDTPEHQGIKDLAIAAQSGRSKTAEIASRLATGLLSPMSSSDTVMLRAAGDYRHTPKDQTGKAWAKERYAAFLPQLNDKAAGVLKSERKKLEAMHSDDYKRRSLFDPDHNLLTSPVAIAGHLLEDVVPGLASVAGLTQAMGGGSTSYLAELSAPFIAEGVATYYQERDRFHDHVMRQSADNLVRAYPEYAAMLGRYPNETEARKVLIEQEAHLHAYEEAVKSIFLSLGMKRFVKSTRTGEEGEGVKAAQNAAMELLKEVKEDQERM